MIYEFALDPELVALWYDPKEFAFFREAFSEGTGRIGSRFPKKWPQSVIKAFRALPSAKKDSKSEMRLQALLQRLEEQMIKRESPCADDASWLAKVEAEHRERPFYGILSLVGSDKVAEVMTPHMLINDDPPVAWMIPPNPAPHRTALELSQAVAPLLTSSRHVVFVDPWFDPSPLSGQRYLDSLQAMLAIMWGDKRCFSAPVAELVTAEGNKRGGPGLLSQCLKELPKIIPKGGALKVTVVRQRDGGEKTHNRYILTEVAGVAFGVGLDAARSEDHASTDDICRLSRDQFLKRQGQYVSAPDKNFEITAGPKVIYSRFIC